MKQGSVTTLKHRDELMLKLRDKEYRDAFVSSHVNNGIPFQIRILREQREWTQEDLAKRTGKKQTAISRLENPNYGGYTLNTLKELASAFDVALLMKFVPFSELLDWDARLSHNSLKVMSFEEEFPFEEKHKKVPVYLQKYLIGIEGNVYIANFADSRKDEIKKYESESLLSPITPPDKLRELAMGGK